MTKRTIVQLLASLSLLGAGLVVSHAASADACDSLGTFCRGEGGGWGYTETAQVPINIETNNLGGGAPAGETAAYADLVTEPGGGELFGGTGNWWPDGFTPCLRVTAFADFAPTTTIIADGVNAANSAAVGASSNTYQAILFVCSQEG